MAHCLTTFAFLHCVSETVKKKKHKKKTLIIKLFDLKDLRWDIRSCKH